MDQIADLKSQRDRFLAFAMAAADLCLEVDRDDVIVHSFGATHSLLSEKKDVEGKALLSFFEPADHLFMRRMLARARTEARLVPTVVRLGKVPNCTRVTLGACSLAPGGNLFLSLTSLSAVLTRQLPVNQTKSGLIDNQQFQALTLEALKSGGIGSDSPDGISLVRLDGLARVLRRLPKERADEVLAELGALFRDHAIGGILAARVGAEDFAIVSSKGRGSGGPRLDGGLKDVIHRAGADREIVPSRVSIRIDPDLQDAEKTATAISYALTTFSANGSLNFKSLEEGLTEAVGQTAERMTALHSVISTGRFKLVYQPVVNVRDHRTHHFEALMRFEDGQSPYETVVFTEQTGLVADLDLAATQRILQTPKTHSGHSVAVNISGRSIEGDVFRNSLFSILSSERALANRLLFEITESSEIKEVDASGKFIAALRARGFKVCLDDFGAGAAGYNYLRAFEVDFVKIDGSFLQSAIKDKRQWALVHSLSVLCRDLNCRSIAEMVENSEHLRLVSELDIDLAQGYLMGRPTETLPTPSSSGVARRKGAVESWG